MNEQLKELIEELENCAEGIAIGRGESFSRAVEIAPLLLRKTVDEIKAIFSENARFATENDALGAKIGFYKRQSQWLTDEIDRIVCEYEEKLQDLRKICDEKSD